MGCHGQMDPIEYPWKLVGWRQGYHLDWPGSPESEYLVGTRVQIGCATRRIRLAYQGFERRKVLEILLVVHIRLEARNSVESAKSLV